MAAVFWNLRFDTSSEEVIKYADFPIASSVLKYNNNKYMYSQIVATTPVI